MEISNSEKENLHEKGSLLRQALLKYPTEKQTVDYKSGIKFVEKSDFSYSLVKHILGMANAGGGHIVIGYEENESKIPEATAISEEIVASYDPSKLAQFIEKHVLGTDKINLVIHKEKHPDNGLFYPIIEVMGFTNRPFFCKSTVGVLKEAALYIRAESARTIAVATPDLWDKLIDICVDRRQSQMLKRFTSLMEEMGLASVDNDRKQREALIQQEWLAQQRKGAKEITLKNKLEFEGMEFAHWLEGLDKHWQYGELLSAAEKSKQRKTGWPIGIVSPDRPGLQNENLVSHIVQPGISIDYWSLSRDGNYYFFRNMEEDWGVNGNSKGLFWFDVRIWRIAEAIDHCIDLYKTLGVPPETRINFYINHFDLEDRMLTASDSRRAFLMNRRHSKSKSTEWSKDMTLDYLYTERERIIIEVCKAVFVHFDIWEPADDLIKNVIASYDKGY